MTQLARTLMIQGTASSVGKSLLVTGLCRLLARQGVRVAPFKSQNMALNAAVTPDGGEIGRAQMLQAEAAGARAHVDMNPILLKPEGPARSQVVVLGKPIGSMAAVEYHQRKPELRGVVADALTRVRQAHDVVVIEGAGSPAEINLRDRDLVNMYVAGIADAPVWIVGDIDRGGVFAAFVGTLALLEPHERARVTGFVINKFRGDPALLTSGLTMLHERSGVPCVGVVPHLERLRLADEDSLAIDDRAGRARAGAGELDVVVVRLPRISNHDDVAPLEHEPGVVVRFVERAEDLAAADLVILPGSKSTVADLTWLRQRGLSEAIVARALRGQPVLGLCGGCQMLGHAVHDPGGVESPARYTAGLGLLPLETRFAAAKTTAQVVARAARASFLAAPEDGALEGYEIHMGEVSHVDASAADAAFTLTTRNGAPAGVADGAVSPEGHVVGTLVHGLFENAPVRARLVQHLRARRGLPAPLATSGSPTWSRSDAYDRLADALERHLEPQAWKALLDVGRLRSAR
jgi:adenosylcobyric acid synthase